MPKYRNATNRVLVVNGVKIPPGGIIDTTEEVAKRARGTLQFVPEGAVPRMVSVPSRGGGLSEEERARLERLETMFETMMTQMPDMMKSMQDSIKEEIQNQQPTIVEKTITVTGTAGGSEHIFTSDEPIPVILDDVSTAESNLADSADIQEKEADSVQDKLNKLRELRSKSDE